MRKKYRELSMQFRKYAKIVVITIPFVSSLFKSVYYLENEAEYYFSTLINKV